MFKKILMVAAVLAGLFFMATPAKADTRVSVRYSYGYYGGYCYRPAPVYVVPAPVYVSPPVYYYEPVRYYSPPPAYYYPAPTYYYGPTVRFQYHYYGRSYGHGYCR